jgi:hypothetical protein
MISLIDGLKAQNAWYLWVFLNLAHNLFSISALSVSSMPPKEICPYLRQNEAQSGSISTAPEQTHCLMFFTPLNINRKVLRHYYLRKNYPVCIIYQRQEDFHKQDQ